MARLFVAVWPPPSVVEAIAALPRPEVSGLGWTGPAQWHVTLRFLGRVDDVDVARVALREVRWPAADVELGPEVRRFGQRVLLVPVTGLEGLAPAVVAATRDVGEPPEDRPFTGHITLARVRGSGRRPVAVDLRPFVGQPVAGSWRAGELTLVESRLLATGAAYEIVERVPLIRAASSG